MNHYKVSNTQSPLDVSANTKLHRDYDYSAKQQCPPLDFDTPAQLLFYAGPTLPEFH